MAGDQFLCHVVSHKLPSHPETTAGFVACARDVYPYSPRGAAGVTEEPSNFHAAVTLPGSFSQQASSAGLAALSTWQVKGQGIILVPYCSRPKPAPLPGQHVP